MEPLERRDLLTGYVSVSATTSSVSEGSPASFGIYCMNPPAAGVTVHYQTTPGSATSGVDYTPLSGSVFLSPSTPSATINVSTTADTVNDPGESFSFTLTSVVGDAFLGSSSAGVTINQPSGPPQGPAPGSLTLDPVGTLSEGQVFYLTGRITPPATYSVSATINWGGFATMAGSGANFTTNSDGSFAIANKYYDDGVSPGNGTASDVANISMTATVTGVQLNANSTATIHNLNPTGIFNLYGYMGPLGGRQFELTALLADPGIADVQKVTIDWGDGSPPEVVSNVALGTQLTLHHAFLPTGQTYPVSVLVEDDDLGTLTWGGSAPMYLLDINSDADNSGAIDQYDEIIEADPPGAKVLVNDDDDDQNGTLDMNQSGPISGEDDLAEFLVRFTPAFRPEVNNYVGWHVALVRSPTGAAQFYESADKSGPLVFGQTPIGEAKIWTVGQDTIPSSLFIEGLTEGVTIGLSLLLLDPGYTEIDSDSVVFTVVVNNSPPLAIDDFFEVGNSPQIVFSNADLLANDTDPDYDSLSIVAVESQPANGQLSWNQGVFTYTPNTGFTGTDTFTYRITDGKHFDTANVFLMVNAVAGPWGWLHAKRPLNDKLKWTWVPDKEADEIGVFARRNGDNDNDANGPDLSENTGAGVANENDLIYVNLRLTHMVSALRASGFPVSLKRSDAAINVWGTGNKTGPILVGADTYELIPPPDGKSYSMWVEWVGAGAGPSTLELWVGATKVDELVFHPFSTVVIGFVGENQTPGDMTNGMTQIINKLYNSAYDAYIFDEDDPMFDLDFESEEVAIDFPFGAGDAADLAIKEVKSAVTERGVENVSILGYSHGGGATYVLADRLVTEMPAGAVYDMPFTAYIDGVAKRSVFAETRSPPTSDNHYNVWQHRVGALPGIQFIQGASIAGSFINDDVDSAGEPFFFPFPGKMHTNILAH